MGRSRPLFHMSSASRPLTSHRTILTEPFFGNFSARLDISPAACCISKRLVLICPVAKLQIAQASEVVKECWLDRKVYTQGGAMRLRAALAHPAALEPVELEAPGKECK